MTIQEILDNILHAVFGRDVRQSIHDGIERANDICDETEERQTALETKYDLLLQNCTSLSPSDVEIVDARIKADGTSYPTLKDRLDSIESDSSMASDRISKLENGINVYENPDNNSATITFQSSNILDAFNMIYVEAVDDPTDPGDEFRGVMIRADMADLLNDVIEYRFVSVYPEVFDSNAHKIFCMYSTNQKEWGIKQLRTDMAVAGNSGRFYIRKIVGLL